MYSDIDVWRRICDNSKDVCVPYWQVIQYVKKICSIFLLTSRKHSSNCDNSTTTARLNTVLLSNTTSNTFDLKEYPDYKYKPRKKLKPHERGHKPRGRRPANPDAPRKPRSTTARNSSGSGTNAPRKRGKAKLLLASLRQGRASMAPLTQGPASQPQPGIYFPMGVPMIIIRLAAYFL